MMTNNNSDALTRQIRQHYRDQISSVIAALAEAYPAAFQVRQSHRVPLKADILDDLRQQRRELGDVTVDGLVRAVHHYQQSFGYLNSLRPGVPRVDLAGEPAGVVTEEEAAVAKAEQKAARERQQWDIEVDAVDLAQWFDLAKPIRDDDLEAVVAQLMYPDDDGCRRQYRKVRQAVNRHNARMRD
jgi:hypothetical protein